MPKQTENNILSDNAVLEDVQLKWRNFAGEGGKFNREGNRNFTVDLPLDVAEQMAKDGWAVKWRDPRDEDDEPRADLNVILKFGGPRPPKVVLVTGRGQTILDEKDVVLLDTADIIKTDLIIRPYNWEINGNTGVKAYVKSMYVTIEEDVLEAKYGAMRDEYED